jgi:chromosomal replication initiation ATPase DnaA
VAQLLTHVAHLTGLQVAELTTNTHRHAVVRARAMISYVAVRHAGLSARQVAAPLGVSPRTVLDGLVAGERSLAAQPRVLSVLLDTLSPHAS